MGEHKVCKGCGWNKYPLCEGTIISNGEFLNIENLKPGFECGQKDELKINDFSIKIKPELELRIEALEEKTKDLTEMTK